MGPFSKGVGMIWAPLVKGEVKTRFFESHTDNFSGWAGFDPNKQTLIVILKKRSD